MLLRAGIFTFLMSIALTGLTQVPSVGNRMTSSEIRVRIPSYVIIQLANNSTNKTSINPLANPDKKAELRNPAQGTIISNQEWVFYVEVQPVNPEKLQSKPDFTDTLITYTTSSK